MCAELFLVFLGFELLEVVMVVLHHTDQQADGVDIDLMILVPATFVYHGEESHKDLLPLILFNLIKSKLAYASIQITESFALQRGLLGVQHHHHPFS